MPSTGSIGAVLAYLRKAQNRKAPVVGHREVFVYPPVFTYKMSSPVVSAPRHSPAVVAIILFSLCLAFGSGSTLAQICSPLQAIFSTQLGVTNQSFVSNQTFQTVSFSVSGSYTLYSIELRIRRSMGPGVGQFGSFGFFTNEGGSNSTATQPGTLLTPPGWIDAPLSNFSSSGIGTPIINITASPVGIDAGIWWLTINFTSGYSWFYNFAGTSYDWKESDDGASWSNMPLGSGPAVAIHACPAAASSPSSSPRRSPSPPSSSPVTSLLPSPSPLSLPSQSASPSPSPTRLCSTNSSFSSSGNPTLNLTSNCQTTSSAGSSGVNVGLSSELSEVLLGDSIPSQIDWQVVHVNESTTGVTYVYSAANITSTGSSNASVVRSFETTFLFTRVATQTNFSGLLFDVYADFIKWSVKLDRDNDDDESEATPLTLRYALSQYINLTSSTATAASTQSDLVRKVEVSEQVTRYLLSLCASCLDGNEAITGQLDVLEFALIDGHLQRINHSVIVNNASGVVSFELELVFPVFSRSLVYDPSLGLLLGSGRSSSGGGGSDNDAVVIGVAVAIPIAVVVVLVVVAGLMAASWIKWRKLSRQGDSVVHFDAAEEEGVYSTL